jgi:hypothetical protein
VLDRFGNSDPFFAVGTTLREYTQVGMAPGEPGTGGHGGQDCLPEALAAPCSLKGRDSLLEAVNRLAIVALGLVGEAEALVRERMQNDIPAGRGARQGGWCGDPWQDQCAFCPGGLVEL